MSFSGRTPESLVPRSDSKNPATTCKGLTASGRPCRRALAASPRASPVPSPTRNGRGVLAVLDEDDAAAFYCWQHKDQAEALAAQAEQRTTLFPLKERSSTDTLAEQVGVIDLDSEVSSRRRRKRRSRTHEQHVTKRDTLPPGWHDMQGPLMTVPEEYVPKPPRRQEYSHGRSNVVATWTCCIRAEDDEPPPEPKPHPRRHGGYKPPQPMQLPASRPSSDIRRKAVPSAKADARRPAAKPQQGLGQPTAHSNSETQALLSLIPSYVSPQTTLLLLTELSKPISPADEAGYLYIFLLTSESGDKPDDDTATTIMDDSGSDEDQDYTGSGGQIKPKPSPHQRRQSEALKRYASVRTNPAESSKSKTTVLLKIGRAANVHRRMSQWTKQCGQDITLVRYYPYRPSLANGSNDSGKCPHIHRVERLVHLELADQRVASEPCDCGRAHKEIFAIDASRKGLRKVDQTIKRWVKWAEQQQGQHSNADVQPVVKTPDRAKLRPVDGYY
jgi:hypothetical protein